MMRVGVVASIFGVIAFLAIVVGLTVSALRFMLVVGAITLVVAIVAAMRGRNRPDVALTDENDPTPHR
jgi:membrane-bound ClpP family serine protease